MGGEELLEPDRFISLMGTPNPWRNRISLHAERMRGVACRKRCGADLFADGWLELVFH
jgi:hypothetical protein